MSPLKEVANQAAANLFADALVATEQKLPASGSIVIAHGQGRIPTGYLFIRKNADVEPIEDMAYPDRLHAIRFTNPTATELVFDLLVIP